MQAAGVMSQLVIDMFEAIKIEKRGRYIYDCHGLPGKQNAEGGPEYEEKPHGKSLVGLRLHMCEGIPYAQLEQRFSDFNHPVLNPEWFRCTYLVQATICLLARKLKGFCG